MDHLPQVATDKTNPSVDTTLQTSVGDQTTTPGLNTANSSATDTDNATRPEFERFPRFPFELREMILKYGITARFVKWVAGGGKPPALLQVSYESRGVVRKSYVMCDVGDAEEKRVIFFNPEKDIVYCTGMYPGRSISVLL